MGVLLAVLYFFFKMSKSIDVESKIADIEQDSKEQGTLVFRMQGPIFFGAVERIEQAMQLHQQDIHTVILRFGWVPVMDITALRSLEKSITSWQKRNINVKLSGVNALIERRMQRSGLWALIGDQNIVKV